MKSIQAAGILMYRTRGEMIEVFLVHPGGPFYKNKDEGAWSIPKGLLDDGERVFVAARREFQEETGIELPNGIYIELGSVTYQSGNAKKELHGYAFLYDYEGEVRSNFCDIEYPPGTGKKLSIPEIDEGKYFSVPDAIRKIAPAQRPFIERLLKAEAPNLQTIL